MKIQQVKIKDFKVLSNVEEDVKGNNILIMGDNGVGKSSFIQFIEIALGKKTNIPPGAEGEGVVITDNDGKEYTFSVKFKSGKPVITVTTPDGMKDSRKGVLAGIVGAIDFDIDSFVELSKSVSGRKTQVEIFKSFLSEDIKKELARFEADSDASYEERTDINRDIKLKEGSIQENPLYNQVAAKRTFERADASELQKEYDAINNNNTKAKEVALRVETRTSDIASKEAVVQELAEQLDRKTKELEEFKKTNTEAKEWLENNKEVDVSELLERINSAAEINSKANGAESLLKDIAKVEELKEEAGELTAKIGSSKQAIEDTIKDMESPVDGLSYDDDTLIYNGISVSPDSLSTSEIMELGVMMKMAENPDLGILFIERGESLGAKRLKHIQDLAKKNDWQIIMEQVERGEEKLHIEIMEG